MSSLQASPASASVTSVKSYVVDCDGDNASEASFKSTNSKDNADVKDILERGVHLVSDIGFDNIPITWYRFDASQICEELNTWAFNRKLNIEHIEHIYEALKQSKNPCFMGSIKVIKDASNNFQVIDGQHRLQAMRKYINDIDNGLLSNKSKHWNIILEIYHVNSVSDPIVFELFKIANNNLNMTAEDDVNMYIAGVMDAIVSDRELNKGVIDVDYKGVHRPRITKKALYEAMKDNIRAQDTRFSKEEIVARIKRLNDILSTKTNVEMFGRKKISDKNAKQKEKADKLGFYLNLDGKFPPSEWIPMIGDVVL
jgi:hypothetical protein